MFNSYIYPLALTYVVMNFSAVLVVPFDYDLKFILRSVSYYKVVTSIRILKWASPFLSWDLHWCNVIFDS